MDLICFYVELIIIYGYVCLKFGKEFVLIKVCYFIMEVRRGFVFNDVFFGDDIKFVVVIGINMGGKMIYIKIIVFM